LTSTFAATGIVEAIPGKKGGNMSRYLSVIVVAAALSACSKEAPVSAPGEPRSAVEAASAEITGPFPKTIRGTIGHSYPLEDGSGNIFLGLLEYENAGIIVSSSTFESKGMTEDDAEVSLSIEPLGSGQCGEAAQCFKGY
jgi:hypothetical protein